ncbi:DUF3080 family protein [Motilimonas cestriensis]|uniref:DUF3080 family protein n=1 Tax=Motilimonas cestriensis TaxID=2742685 RepID=UPI003DA287F4
MLLSCSKPEQLAIYQYNELLAQAFEQPVTSKSIQPFPARRDLTLAELDSQLTLLESLQLKQCDLLYLASEKNQILNKHQSGADNFVFQLTLLNQLTQCLQTEQEIPNAERDFLTTLAKEKREKLPAYFWNLLLSDEPSYRFFAQYTQLYPLSGHRFALTSQQSLHYLIDIKQKINSISASSATIPVSLLAQLKQLPEHLAILAQSRYVASLLHSADLASTQLEQTTALLTQHQAEINCHSKRNDVPFSQLKAIFSHRFIKQMQPYLSQINTELHQVMPLLASLLKPYPAQLEVDVTAQLDNVLATQQRLQQANLAHQQQWQTLFERCQQKVGG